MMAAKARLSSSLGITTTPRLAEEESKPEPLPLMSSAKKPRLGEARARMRLVAAVLSFLLRFPLQLCYAIFSNCEYTLRSSGHAPPHYDSSRNGEKEGACGAASLRRRAHGAAAGQLDMGSDAYSNRRRSHLRLPEGEIQKSRVTKSDIISPTLFTSRMNLLDYACA